MKPYVDTIYILYMNIGMTCMEWNDENDPLISAMGEAITRSNDNNKDSNDDNDDDDDDEIDY
jgi:hypothetical protein